MAKWQWCLADDTNNLLKGWQKIGDYWYYLYPNGVMAIGWIELELKWYYLNASGQMQTGWLKDNSKWYYLNTDGTMVQSCKTTMNGTTYNFDANGVWNDSLLSNEGVAFVGSWEGFYSSAYEDPYYPGNSDWWTIGYGTTNAVTPSTFPNGLDSTCTEEQALGWIRDEMSSCATTIKENLASNGIKLSQNEFDSLVSFAYNCGTGSLFGSTLYKNVLAGIKDSATITANFQAWSNANGQRSEGLYKRRTKEAAMFISGDYTGNV